ncbi:MAG: hypothetical protein HUJ65_00760, partial [Oscillospiraceae bacterium]|nr:hypothetical protein [Oscillospiraceae bacterium]
MLKRFLKLLFVLTAAVLMLATALPALAAAPVSITIPVEIKATGSVPAEPETYTLVLTADTAGAPMPSGAVNGRAEKSVIGPGKTEFKIEYNTSGVYTYTIVQKPGSSTNGRYDETVY